MTFYEWMTSARGELTLAALAGSAVSAVFEWEGILPGIRRIFVGTVTAYFLGPVSIPLFQWVFGKIDVPPESASSVGGFFVGVVGMIIIEVMLKVMRHKRDELTKDQNNE